MTSGQRNIFLALAALLIAAAVGLFLTSDWAYKPRQPGAAEQTVDQKPLQTARTLASLASNPEEREFAAEALRLSDHEVDVAFAAALRNTAEHNDKNAETRNLDARVQRAEATVKATTTKVDQLTKAVAAAPDAEKPDLQQQLALQQAQLELDQDELDDAHEDLARAGGDTHTKIQRLLDEHNSQHGNAPVGTAAVPLKPERHLASQVQFIFALWNERVQLRQAMGDARDKAASLAKRHDTLEQQARAEQVQPSVASANESELAGLQRLSKQQKTLADFDRRVQDEQQLAEVYARWDAVVSRRLHAGAHAALTSIFLILIVALLVFVLDRVVDRSFGTVSLERRRVHTLRTVLRLAVQVVGVVVILVIVLGPPRQLSTFLGLLSAGLAVILKDFIVAFFGWFVLMGKNGIRVGDWVEIEGVRGEVLEIGLLRTVLLETGDASDPGHPTGRKVSFVNSFAVEGHYFNFTTSGQWLWDEVQVAVPLGENPYDIAEELHKLVAKEVGGNEQHATEEWRRLHRESGQEFSAATTINLKPVSGAVEITIRYVTRAYERASMRSKLYTAIVRFLHDHRRGTRATVVKSDA